GGSPPISPLVSRWIRPQETLQRSPPLQPGRSRRGTGLPRPPLARPEPAALTLLNIFGRDAGAAGNALRTRNRPRRPQRVPILSPVLTVISPISLNRTMQFLPGSDPQHLTLCRTSAAQCENYC